MGSGRLVKKAKSFFERGGSYDWGNLIGEDFLSIVTNSSSMVSSYSCPICNDLI